MDSKNVATYFDLLLENHVVNDWRRLLNRKQNGFLSLLLRKLSYSNIMHVLSFSG